MIPWKKPVYTKPSQWLRTIAAGAVMGCADIVPGISGGTVAFIMGIYEDLLQSISSFRINAFKLILKGKFRAFFEAVSWQFLLALIIGVATSFILFAKIITFLLNHEVYRVWLYSGFIGLVGGSIFFCFKQLSTLGRREVCAFIVAAIVAFLLSGTDLMPKKEAEKKYDIPLKHLSLDHQAKNYDSEKKELKSVPESYLPGMVAKKYISEESEIVLQETMQVVKVSSVLKTVNIAFLDPWIVVCGMMAVSAMLLPGISGSYLLTILGMYGFILGALIDFCQGISTGIFDRDAFSVIIGMVVGIALGALLFSRVVLYLLHRFHNATIAALIGFMVGALRAVWPFWTYSYELHPLRLHEKPELHVVEPFLPSFSVQSVIAILFAITGFMLVLLIEYLAAKKRSKG